MTASFPASGLVCYDIPVFVGSIATRLELSKVVNDFKRIVPKMRQADARNSKTHGYILLN